MFPINDGCAAFSMPEMNVNKYFVGTELLHVSSRQSRFEHGTMTTEHRGHQAYRRCAITIGYTTSGEVAIVGVVGLSSPPRDP
ncbi:MAG: hypothetical protein AAF802_33635 [Planctomycetota bacterium]